MRIVSIGIFNLGIKFENLKSEIDIGLKFEDDFWIEGTDMDY